MTGKTSKKLAKKAPAAAKTVDASQRIDAKIAELGDWRGEQLAEIRALVHDADPDVVEEWKWMGTPTWSHHGIYVIANPHKDKVKITFSHGAQLRDPKKLFNAGLEGNKWRAIDLYEGDALDRTAFKALVREAVAYNERQAATKSTGGRKKAASDDGAATTGRKKKATKDDAAPSAGPKLLAGGNPQIPKGDGDGPVQAYIAAMPGWKSAVGRRLDELIVRTVPNVRKAVRWNSPFYGVEGQGWFLGFHCLTKYIKIAFFRGTSLKPLPPGESKQEETRYLDIYEDDEIDEKRLASWVRQASKIPGWVP